MRAKLLAAGIAASVVLASSAAWADVEKSQRTDEGDYHIFKDDPLNADGLDTLGVVLKVRDIAARVTLIRPRTSFVPEMYKSVENL